jgi:chromosome segregation ATPase
MTAEWKQRQAEAKIETARLIAVEREQMRLAKEQEKQGEQLAKHEKRIADLEFRMSQAESDIEFLNDRIAQLDAQRDYLLLQQSGTIPGGKEHTKYQTKIISIDNQIHTAESKLTKARHIKAMAERELSA